MHFYIIFSRLQSRGLESLTAGLQSLRLASRLKPWLRTIDGLGWLMAASQGLQVQTRKLTTTNNHIQFSHQCISFIILSTTKNISRRLKKHTVHLSLYARWCGNLIWTNLSRSVGRVLVYRSTGKMASSSEVMLYILSIILINLVINW